MATHSNFTSAFAAMYKKIEKVQKDLPAKIANEGTRFWIQNFDNEGFTDINLQKWQPRKVLAKMKKNDLKRKLLVKTGRLKRAVNNSVVEKNRRRVVWLIRKGEVPYANYVNEGTNKMPQRQFIGSSSVLNKRFRALIIKSYKEQFK